MTDEQILNALFTFKNDCSLQEHLVRKLGRDKFTLINVLRLIGHVKAFYEQQEEFYLQKLRAYLLYAPHVLYAYPYYW
jgi:hypothetical protein